MRLNTCLFCVFVRLNTGLYYVYWPPPPIKLLEILVFQSCPLNQYQNNFNFLLRGCFLWGGLLFHFKFFLYLWFFFNWFYMNYKLFLFIFLGECPIFLASWLGYRQGTHWYIYLHFFYSFSLSFLYVFFNFFLALLSKQNGRQWCYESFWH